MCCTTFLHAGELNIPTSNKDLNTVLADVRIATKEDWQVVEVKFKTPKRLFRKQTEYSCYELYKYVGGCGPWQIINFYRDNSSSSINFTTSAELVMAFLFGILSGVNTAERNIQNANN